MLFGLSGGGGTRENSLFHIQHSFLLCLSVVVQVELFCVGNLINCVLEADEEFLCMDFRFTLRDGGMRATFQLLHMVLEV
jgi:hypothetical protein